jgi:peptidoglycan/LPS O-acetylase OafA/YrhL
LQLKGQFDNLNPLRIGAMVFLYKRVLEVSFMKRHFEVLDGLRGTAAISVVLFHLLEWLFPDYAKNPLRHAYLAVDFFFMLSGFVIGYAYDDRWQKMKIVEFLRTRIIRLHPLVLLGVAIGVAGYWLDPFASSTQSAGIWRMLIGAALGALMLPSPALAKRYDETHSLNGPHWSLTMEYFINIVYAFVGPRMSKKVLGIVVFLSAIALTATAIGHGNLQGGWGWSTFWMAPVRVTFPFFMGLLIYRMNFQISIKGAYIISSLLLVAVFAGPSFKTAGVYEAFSVIVLFPLIVALGAGGNVSGFTGSLCNFSGRISYPIYITHYPFIYMFGHWVYKVRPSALEATAVSLSLVAFFILLAWVSLRFFDEPVRARLNAYVRNLKKR